MADSVGSLDPHRSDDVHSLDGTEYTNDYESVTDDLDFPLLISEFDHDGENEALLATHQRNPEPSDIADEEVYSLSSLEYTHHSLGTPSISTPEASRLTERPPSIRRTGPTPQQTCVNCQGPSKKKPARLWKVGALVKDYTVCVARTTLPGLLFAAALFLFVPVWYKDTTEKSRPQSRPVASTITQTYAVVSVTKTSSPARSHPSSTGGMSLILLDDQKPDEWLFGARKPVFSFTPRAPSDVVVHVADDVKQSWLQKGCLTVTALREDRRIETTLSPVGQDLLLKFPRKEAYGVVRLALEATCRPKMQRMVNVHFRKGVMDEFMEMTSSFAHDLTGLVSVAAHEAERYLAGSKRLLCAVSDSISHTAIFVSDNLANRLARTMATAQKSTNAAKSGVAMLMRDTVEGIVKNLDATTQQMTRKVHQVQNIQTRLQLALLNAQLSANIWWLEATGRKAEHDDYQLKAKDLMAKKRAAAKEALKADRRQDAEAEKPCRQWLRMRRRCRGQDNPRRGRSSTQEARRGVVA